MARAEVDSAATTGHSVAGDSRMFLTRASKPWAASAAADEAAPPPSAGSGRGAIAAAPQKLQNLAPSGTCLPHWPQNIGAVPLELRARGRAQTPDFALGLRGIQLRRQRRWAADRRRNSDTQMTCCGNPPFLG